MSSQYIEVLEKLKKNNKWSSSVFQQLKTIESSTVNDNITITEITFTRDNERCQWKGTAILKTNENKIIEEGSHVEYTIMNGEQYLLAIGFDLNTLRSAFIKQIDYRETQSLMLDSPDLGSALWGRVYGNNGMDIYNLIEQSQNIKYGKSNSLIDGLECYEIEGTCRYGSTKIIFSPERGYFPLKWEITKKSGDYFDTELLDISIKDWKVSFYASEVKYIDGFYVPVKGRMQHDVISKDDRSTSLFCDYDLSNIQLSPDFEAINAFNFDLPSNVPVTLETAPGIKFHFNNSKLTPIIDQDFLNVLDDAIPTIKAELNVQKNESKVENKQDVKLKDYDKNISENQDDVKFNKIIVILIIFLSILVIIAILFFKKSYLRNNIHFILI